MLSIPPLAPPWSLHLQPSTLLSSGQKVDQGAQWWYPITLVVGGSPVCGARAQVGCSRQMAGCGAEPGPWVPAVAGVDPPHRSVVSEPRSRRSRHALERLEWFAGVPGPRSQASAPADPVRGQV